MGSKNEKAEITKITLNPELIKSYIEDKPGKVFFSDEQKKIIMILKENQYDINALTPEQRRVIINLHQPCLPEAGGECWPGWDK